MTNSDIPHPAMRGFPSALGKCFRFSPSSIPALASAFTTAVMVPLCPRACCASNGGGDVHLRESGERGYEGQPS
jgi:hypothetical protein